MDELRSISKITTSLVFSSRVTTQVVRSNPVTLFLDKIGKILLKLKFKSKIS